MYHTLLLPNIACVHDIQAGAYCNYSELFCIIHRLIVHLTLPNLGQYIFDTLKMCHCWSVLQSYT